MSARFYVYILRCGDQSLYTGITTDIARRFQQHRKGKGARYTRSRGVEALVYSEGPMTHTEAAQREHALKKLSRAAKLQIIQAWESSLQSDASQVKST